MNLPRSSFLDAYLIKGDIIGQNRLLHKEVTGYVLVALLRAIDSKTASFVQVVACQQLFIH